MIYELARMSHFIDKLELLIDNCPTTESNQNAETLRVSIPHYQTKDAIDQIRMHLDELIKKESK